MNNIFAIRKDLPTYQVLDLDLLDVTRNLAEDVDLDSVYDFSQLNTSMVKWWQTPETKYIGVGKGASKTPDISCWIDATLVLSPRAHRLLKDALDGAGEFLPVLVNGQEHYIFNCFQLCQTDQANSTVIDHGEITSVLTHIEFEDSASKHLVFKSKAENCLTLFCNQRFKEIVESFDLNGVIFDDHLIVA